MRTIFWSFPWTKKVTKNELRAILERFLAYNLTIKNEQVCVLLEISVFPGEHCLQRRLRYCFRERISHPRLEDPSSLGELRRFIGNCLFLNKFTPSLSAIASLFYAAAARMTFDWNQIFQQAFEAVVLLFLSAPLLHHADGNVPF